MNQCFSVQVINSLVTAPLEMKTEDGDQNRDVETNDNGNVGLNEREDSNVETNKDTTAEGDDKSDKSADNLAEGKNSDRRMKLFDRILTQGHRTMG